MKISTTHLAEKETSLSKEEKALVERIVRNLSSNAVLDPPASIRIEVDSEGVHLSGQVVMQAEKQMVEEIVRLTAGVGSVDNRIEIVPCGGKKGSA
jgi:osmotically-inducible protein OsmY